MKLQYILEVRYQSQPDTVCWDCKTKFNFNEEGRGGFFKDDVKCPNCGVNIFRDSRIMIKTKKPRRSSIGPSAEHIRSRLREATYDTRGKVFSQKFTLIDPAADRSAPYIYFQYGDVKLDKLPRKSVYYDSANDVHEFIAKKKQVFEIKIRKLEAEVQALTPTHIMTQIGHQPGEVRALQVAHEGLEILNRARIVSVTVKYEN